jgi:hypothetical protein
MCQNKLNLENREGKAEGGRTVSRRRKGYQHLMKRSG